VRKISDLKHFALKGFRQSFAQLHLLASCDKLDSLDLEDSLLNDDELMNGLKEFKSI